MSERWTPRSELLSELHLRRNQIVAELAGIDMAIMREKNAPEAKAQNTVTLQTQDLLRRHRPIWVSDAYQRQALSQSDAKEMQIEPPYENLIQ